MAHFAELDENNIVLRVVVISNEVLLDENGVEQEQKGVEFCKEHYGGKWIQSSYNGNFRKHHAQIGGYYDPQIDVFIGNKQ